MKKLFIILFCFINIIVYGTTYYVKTGGDDEAAGTSDETAWATITKVNAVWAAGVFAPGDSILFKRGDTFYGALAITEGGTSGSYITVGAYGTGDDPVITGLQTLTTWTDEGDGIYSKSITITGAHVLTVLIDDTMRNMGKYPNNDEWNVIQSASGDTKIHDDNLQGFDFTGGKVVIRKSNHYQIDVFTITAHSNDTITYSGGSVSATAGWGYYIEKDLGTLDTYGEWYYSSSAGKIYVYFGTELPGDHTIEVAHIGDLVTFTTYKRYLNFENIHFKGCNDDIFYGHLNNYVTVKNCTLEYGYNGVYQITCTNWTIDSCTIRNVYGYGIRGSGFSNHYMTVTNNTIENIGIYPGLTNESRYRGPGMFLGQGDNHLAEYNTINRTGFNGITFTGDNTIIRYNWTDSTNINTDDGGGIYYGGGASYVDMIVRKNIVTNPQLALGGMKAGTPNMTRGIYMDYNTSQITIDSNTVYNVPQHGIFIFADSAITVDNNLVYDALYCMSMDNYLTTVNEDITLTNNTFIAKTSTQYAFRNDSESDDFTEQGTFDYNLYARPIDDNLTIYPSYPGYYVPKTLAEWQTFSGQDAHSNKSPISVSDDSKIKFYYNATKEDSTFTLTDDLITMAGDKFKGDTVIASYSSAIFLIDPDPVVDPPDIPTITTDTAYFVYPLSITLTGNVTDDGGGTVKSKGMVYGTTSSPSISSGDTINGGNGEGEFTVTATGLVRGLTYYVRAYAVNEIDTVYGNSYVIYIKPKYRVKSNGKYVKSASNYVILDSKQNLLLYSEDLTNAAWKKWNTTVTAGAVPDLAGNATMDTVKQTGDWGNVNQDVTVYPGLNYEFSFDVQRGAALEVPTMYYRVLDNISGKNIVVYTNYYSRTNADSPVRINVPFTTPAGCTSVKVYIVVLSTGSSGSFYAGRAQLSYPGMNYVKTTSTNVE